MRVRAGTSGYSYAEWKGNFYPEKTAAKDMLGFYASRFPAVEINNTFYRMPKEDLLLGWAAQVPESFAFAIKAPQKITHIARLKDAGDLVTYLYRVTASLAARLGPLLFQLPPNFKKDVPRLAAFLKALPDRRRVAFEFRHASWFDDEVFAALRARGVALCVADTGEEPAAPLVATADWGYLRLRRELFSDDQLAEWARRIAAQPWSDAFVFLKHEEEGKGPKLAARLMALAGADAVPAGAAPPAAEPRA
ncbi:MAG: DUF72 domain-containing protein [Candidatus Eisenbacteria bacterium]|nr:DUF72 domain-containing protein [Candidatus Eisenbacteria bacterium]